MLNLNQLRRGFRFRRSWNREEADAKSMIASSLDEFIEAGKIKTSNYCANFCCN